MMMNLYFNIDFKIDFEISIVLSGYRVEQMTKTYYDIDAVTKLLDEKEKDLELAATIGQQLLEKNQFLDNRIEYLERELEETVESVNQLRHEIVLKDQLLKTFIDSELDNNTNNNSLDDDETTKLPSQKQPKSLLRDETGLLDEYKRKVIELEDENYTLRHRADQCERELTNLEDSQSIMSKSCRKDLEQTRESLNEAQMQLKRKENECHAQHDEIESLLGQIGQLQRQIKWINQENAELKFIHESTSSDMLNQINELKERYNECLCILSRAQEEVATLKSKQLNLRRQKNQPDATMMNSSIIIDDTPIELSSSSSSSNQQQWTSNSLAAQLVATRTTRHSDLFTQATSSAKFVKSVKRKLAKQIPGGTSSSVDSQQLSDSDHDLNESASDHNHHHHHHHRYFNSSTPSFVNDKSSVFMMRQQSSAKQINCPTPESIFSTGSASIYSKSTATASALFVLPEKLQIVKPIEGSQTLQHWQQLATPHMACLFETRPGISIKEACFNMSNTAAEKQQKKNKKLSSLNLYGDKNDEEEEEEEEDFGIFDNDDDEDEDEDEEQSVDIENDDYDDEIDFINKNNHSFSNSFSTENLLLPSNTKLFSPSKVKYLSDLLKSNEQSSEAEIVLQREEIQQSTSSSTSSTSFLGLLTNVSRKFLHMNSSEETQYEKRQKKKKKKRHDIFDDPDTPPSSPIHFIDDNDDEQQQQLPTLFDYFSSAKSRCLNTVASYLSSSQKAAPATTSTPPGTPTTTMEETEYYRDLNRYEYESTKSTKTSTFFEQIVNKLSQFSFRSIETTKKDAAASATDSAIVRPSPVYPTAYDADGDCDDIVIDDNDVDTTIRPTETPPSSPSPMDLYGDDNDKDDEKNRLDLSKSAFYRVTTLNPLINKSVDLNSLLETLSTLKRRNQCNQRLSCNYQHQFLYNNNLK